ncbi:transcription factor S [archaeon]|nr:transcription factor S [archaeon]|tara:strand:+ start:3156 stop:3476 length:321 start_codon:yes stop_codon:yes gene_type:complete
MNFCPKCGSIMVPVKKRTAAVLTCRKCNYTQKKGVKSVKITEKPQKANKVVVLEKNVTSLPKTEKECPKCNHRKAYWWLQQTRGTDEPPTQFFKCEKCSHAWREYK